MRSNVISGKTKICGLFGDPVAHTVSPAMHNAAFEELGMDGIYLPFRVSKGALAGAVEGARALNFMGFNVTIPHKVAVIPYLDGLDPVAEKIGAVNTVVNRDGELRGYNTDAEGFLRALLERGVEPAGKNAVVLGAGGAARAIAYTLAERGACLTILNRLLELDWAGDIAELLVHSFHRETRVLELGPENLEKALDKADVLVNATSVGMSPESDGTPVLARLLRPGLLVFDIVYNPVRTRLLREAEAAGAGTIGGVDMLAWQGALAFEKWTGQPAPLELMRSRAIEALETHED
jgi:shikimate dehydrogenase